MPWVQYWRSEERRKKRGNWDSFMNCHKCLQTTDARVRAAQNCGLIPADKRTGYFRSPMPWQDITEFQPGEDVDEWQKRRDSAVCPGYVVSLPQVQEAALCAAWQDKGCLESRLDGEPVTGLMRDAIDIYRGASCDVEAYMLNGGE